MPIDELAAIHGHNFRSVILTCGLVFTDHSKNLSCTGFEMAVSYYEMSRNITVIDI